MAKGFYIEADLKELIRELRDKGEDLVTIVDAEIAATAKDIERIAAQRAR